MIPIERIAPLSVHYDRYNNALDPLSENALEAKRLFDKSVADLHEAHAADIPFLDFRYELIQWCREYLRKN